VARCKTKYKKHLKGRLVKMVCPSFKCSMMRRVTTKDRFERWKEYASNENDKGQSEWDGVQESNEPFWG
jgi:late competence protein required for DNA uptake (superfamily II DNA/RNA helicase)